MSKSVNGDISYNPNKNLSTLTKLTFDHKPPTAHIHQVGLDRDQALRGARILGCDPGLQRSMGIGDLVCKVGKKRRLVRGIPDLGGPRKLVKG